MWYDLLKFKYGSLARQVLSRDGPMIRRKDSNWWKDILLAGTTNMTSEAWFPNNIKCNLGNGLEIDFWKDKWLGNEAFCSLFPSLYSSRHAEFSMVADNGIWQDTSWRWNLRWAVNNDITAVQELTDLNAVLQGITPSKELADSWSWIPNKITGFSVKRCYEILQKSASSSSLELSQKKAINKLWKSGAPSKINVFGWRLFLDRLPTKSALMHRGILDDSQNATCVFCSEHVESSSHLFFSCRKSADIWKKIHEWLGIIIHEDIVGIEHFLQHGQQLKGKAYRKTRFLIWLATVWNIWLLRNAIIFKGAVADSKNLTAKIQALSWSWLISKRDNMASDFVFSNWLDNPLELLLSKSRLKP